MLARLVVHLQANYGNLTAGLRTARNETVVAAQSIRQSVASVAEGAEHFVTLEQRAQQAATAFETVAATAHVAETTLTAAAFSADLAAGSLTRVSSAVAIVSTGVSAMAGATSVATSALHTVASAAGRTVPLIGGLAQVASSAGTMLSLTARAARTVEFVFGSLATLTRSVAGGLLHIVHGVHATLIVVDLLKSAFSVLLIPLRAIAAVGRMAFDLMAFALRTVLLPVRMLWSGLTLVAKVLFSIIAPIVGVGLAVLKVWFVLKGWIASWKMILHWLSLLPPKARLVVGALLALGIAGKAGAVAMRALSVAVGAVAFVARGAIVAVKLLALPILLIANPARAAALAMQLLAGAVLFAGRIAARAGFAFLGLVGTVGRLAKQGVSAAVSSFTSLGSSLLKAGAHAAAFAAIAGVVWGTKLATAAETSRVVFGTMLHDMAQGKALLDQMQSSGVAPFFDAKQIQDAGRDLLKAKVPVDQITGRLEQLGGIALATKTPIEDLSRIYRQGMAKGAFQTDLVNQLAERGVDIYSALTAVTGQSGQALADMMSAGKIGAAEMNAAIDHMTLGHGIYAGVVGNVAKTTEGMWSTATNNISMALQTMFGVAVGGNNGLLASWVNLTEQFKQRAAAIGPVVMQVTNLIKAVFMGVYSVITTVWTAVFGQTQATFAGMLSSTMEWVTKFRWFFENIVPIVQFVGLMMTMAMVQAFNDIAYWFTTKIPAYLTWFADNWKAVFRDIAVGTMTVFSNMGTNIKNAMGVIWEFIKSGGTTGLEFAWTPLLDGFKSTVAELPDIPDRAMTALEEGLQSQIETIGTGLADSFDSMMTEANASMAAAAVIPQPVPLQSTPAGDQSDPGNSDGTEGAKGEQKIGALAKGSAEAASAIYAAMREKDASAAKTAQRQLTVAQHQLTEQKNLNAKISNANTFAFVESLG